MEEGTRTDVNRTADTPPALTGVTARTRARLAAGRHDALQTEAGRDFAVNPDYRLPQSMTKPRRELLEFLYKTG